MREIHPLISIIFPTYNGSVFLKRNFESISNLDNLEKIELVIIDNNSSDSSIITIKNYKDKFNIRLIESKINVGFAKACNIGAKIAHGKFLFFTNQDVIFPKNFFTILLKLYKKFENEIPLIISPAIYFESKRIDYYGAKIHFLGFSYTPNSGSHFANTNQVKTTQRVSGGALFVKKTIFHKLGGFNERFFMYYEDTDFSLRALRNGFRMLTTNKTFLIHQKHSLSINKLKYYLLERNRILTILLNIAGLKKILPYMIIIEFIVIFHSILINKITLKLLSYKYILKNYKFYKSLRVSSKKKQPLYPFYLLSKNLDYIVLQNLQKYNFFKILINLLNFIFRLS